MQHKLLPVEEFVRVVGCNPSYDFALIALIRSLYLNYFEKEEGRQFVVGFLREEGLEDA